MFFKGLLMVCGVTEERCQGVLRLSLQPRAACIEGRHRGVVRFACILFVKTCFSRSVMDSHCWRGAASVPLRRLVFLGFANGKNYFFKLVGVVAVARWMFAGTVSLVPGKKYFGSWLSSFHGICVSAVSVCTHIIASLFGCDFEETFHVRVAPHREKTTVYLW